MKNKAKSKMIQRLLALALAVCTLGVNIPTFSFAASETYSDPSCGKTEHTHVQECYHFELTCGLEEGSIHSHNTACYEEQTTLICKQAETEAHSHSTACYKSMTTLLCQEEESEGHSHSTECFAEVSALTCSLSETIGHTHTDACMDETGTIVCNEEECEGHNHGEGCYTVSSVQTCGQDEHEGHHHVDTCYTEASVLSCGKEETQGHSHVDACYQTERIQVCALSETEAHTHDESCYTISTQVICELEEHIHTDDCYLAVCSCGVVNGVHLEDCPLYTALICTCGAIEDEHQLDCPLYQAPVCTCGTADHNHQTDCPLYVGSTCTCETVGETHLESCPLYQAPVCTCGTENEMHSATCPLFTDSGLLGSVLGGTYTGDETMPTMNAKLYADAQCSEVVAELMADDAIVSDWEYDTDLYLEVELSNIKTETDTAYQLVIEMQPALYLNITSTPSMNNAKVTCTQNAPVKANGTGAYTPETYSLSNLTYQLSEDINVCSIVLPIRYDNAMWNKLEGSNLGETSSPLLHITLQQKNEDTYVDVEGCDAKLTDATAGTAMPNTRNVVMRNAAGEERAMPIALKSTETAGVYASQMINSGYTEGHFYRAGELVVRYTPPTAIIDGQTYTMLADAYFPVANGEADYVETQENGVIVYTFNETFFSGNSIAQFKNLRFPDGLDSVSNVTTFTGHVTILMDDTTMVDRNISVNLDNSEDPVFSASNTTGLANVYDLETVQFLGGYGIINSGGNSNTVTVKLEFDPQNTNAIGVTTVRVMAVQEKGNTIPVRYTLIHKDTQEFVSGKLELIHPGSETISGVLMSRSDLPANYQEDYYFKTVEYEIECVPEDAYLYHRSATSSRSSGGTVWGYVFSDEVCSYQSIHATLLDTATGNAINKMTQTVKLKVSDDTTVSYGLDRIYLSESDGAITAGESVTIGGDVFVIEYPYTATNCLSDIRIGILLPEGMTVVEQGITATFTNGDALEVEEIIQPESEDEPWIVIFEEGEKIGYANENMDPIDNGNRLKFRIQLNSSTLMPQQTLDLQQNVFVAGYLRSNGASGSYAHYAVEDVYDLTENGSFTDDVGCFSSKIEKKLTINPTPAVLDIDTYLSKTGELDSGSSINMNSFADEILYHINIQCKRGGSAGDFLYIIPIVNTESETDDEFVNANQVDLSMLRAATVTCVSGTQMDVLYTTETFATYEQAKESDAWWSVDNKPENAQWSDVTMLKVVAAQPKTRGANVIIENGTDVTISVALGFDGEPASYPAYAGMKNTWQSRGYYDYTLGYRMAADNSSPEVEVLVKYQPSDKEVITLTAVKNSDADNASLKTAVFVLPDADEQTTMLTAQTYSIVNVQTQDVTLVSSSTDFSTMTSTEASQTFAIKVMTREKGTDTAVAVQDLLKKDTEIELGTLDAGKQHEFVFEIINGDALSDPNTTRYVTFTLVGDNGILIPVQIHVKQILALAEAKGSAIAAGKQYLQFNDTMKSVDISQDAAFTAQFIAEGLFPNNYTGRTLSFTKAPAVGTTIVMIDWTITTAPQYYYYCYESENSGTKQIALTEFKGMGGGADYENPEGETAIKEVLLFIVQFPQSGESVTDDNAISLIRRNTSNTDSEDTLTYHTKPKRTFHLKADKTNANTDQAVVLTYESTASAGKETRYTGGRTLVISASEGYEFPAEARLVADGVTYYQNTNGQFIVPVSAASSVETTFQLVAESVDETVNLSAELWVSATEKSEKPFMGQKVAGPVVISLNPISKPSFKVTGMSKRLLHPDDLNAALTVTYDTKNLAVNDTITLELQRKEQAGYVTETTSLNAVNGSTQHTFGVFDISDSGETLSLRFQPSMLPGTYRLLFTITSSNTEIKVPYGFLLID